MTIPLSSRLTKLSSEKIAQVQAVYDFISLDLQAKADEFIGARLDPLRPFLTTLDTKNVAVALRASLLLWTVTGSLKVPRQMQLESVLSVGARRDSLVNAGTGSGKTLCLVLPVLLDPGKVSLIISPLKRLQILQVVEFEEYGIEACCINSDTKDDADLWKKITTGYFPVLIVSPESLDNFDGHVPRFARHLKAERRFSKSIVRVLIDEIHYIYTAGIPLYGQPAHRPAWGNLAALRIHLDKGTPVQGFSGTLPPHIIKFIIGNLNFREDHDIVTFTANRANITFATRPIVGSLNDLRNLDCVVPIQCKTIIFFDDRTLAAAATTYLDDHPSLSDSDRGRHVVREYHGTMSPTYLTHVFKAFKDPEGGVRILCATSGCATGIDIPDIACVIQYGICQDIPNWRQRGGRAGRADDIEALFLTMYEPWAKTIDLSHATGPRADPDEPLMRVTSKKPSKRQRTGFAMLEVIQSEECLRTLCATYLDDQTTSRTLSTNHACCDRHPGVEVPFSRWLGSAFFVLPVKNKCKPKRGKRGAVRPMLERSALKQALLAWRADAYANDQHRSLRTEAMIIDNKGIDELTRIPQQAVSIEAIVASLDETEEWQDEWARAIVVAISGHDFAVRLQRMGKVKSKEVVELAERDIESEEGVSAADSEPSSSDEEPLHVVLLRKQRQQVAETDDLDSS